MMLTLNLLLVSPEVAAGRVELSRKSQPNLRSVAALAEGLAFATDSLG